jgi:tRNA(Ile)-lysidine synthase
VPTLPLVSAVRKGLAHAGLLRPGVSVVSALSGGPDSVALLDALVKASKKAGVSVVAAHLDHGLRKDSHADAQFCEELCDRMKVRLRSGRKTPAPRDLKDGGLEEAARLVRYAFLRRIAREENASAIVLGHTLDDQAETVLMRLVRGSGALGLSAMKMWDGEILRPLLDSRRAAVLAHLQAQRLPYRTDPTNTDTAFVRNRVRRELLPLLESRFNPGIAEALGRTAKSLAEDQAAIASLATQLVDRAAVPALRGSAYDLTVLRGSPEGLGRAALREALRRAGGLRSVSFVHIERLSGLVAEGRGGATLPLPGGRTATIHKGRLVLTGGGSGDNEHSRESPFLS